MSHHPSPWHREVTGNGNYIVDNTGTKILKFYSGHHHDQDLIAAAPAMLEALKDVEEAWAGNGDMATAVDAVLLALDLAKGPLPF